MLVFPSDGKPIKKAENISLVELETVSTTSTPTTSNYNNTFPDIPEGNSEENEAESDVYYDKEECSLQEYEILKVINLVLFNITFYFIWYAY